MKRISLIGVVGSLILSLATDVRSEVLLAAFLEPSSGRGGIAQLNAMSLEPVQDFPGLANGMGDTCWVENSFNRGVSSRLYTSSLNGDLDSFDALTGRHVVGIARPELQWGGMALVGDGLLAAYTERAAEKSNIRVLDPLTLQDRGPFLLEDTGEVICWLHTIAGDIYGSSPEGTIWRFGNSGQILDSISEPTVEWSGLTSAGGRLFAAFTNPSGDSGGVRMFEPESLRDLGNLLTFPPGHQSGPFELRAANDSLYASFLDGSIDRYDLSGNLLASINRPGVEWRGLAFAPTAVPEPTLLALLSSAAVMANCISRRRR